MDRQPAVSILLPLYNSAPFIETTISSLLAQDFTDFEIVAIDDGSPDHSFDVVRAIQDARIVLHRQPNGGIAMARNAALHRARGKYIAFIDHDDYWHPGKLSAQVAILERSGPDVGACYGNFEIWDGRETAAFEAEPLQPDVIDTNLSGWIYHQLLLTNWVLLSTAVFRREVFDAVGHFDRELPPADDWDLVLRASRSFQFIKVQQSVALYRQHVGQTSRKCPPRDFQTELRQSMILRYGKASPNGATVDPAKLKDREIRSYLSYLSAHLLNGSLKTALATYWRVLTLAPFDRRVMRAMLSVLARFGRGRSTVPR